MESRRGVAMWLSTLSLTISLVAICVSGYLPRRQANYSRSQVVVNFVSFFTEARGADFIEDVRYVCTDLLADSTQVVAVSQLPAEVRGRIYRVANYFDQLGLLVAARALDAEIVIGLLGNWLDQCWRVLEPFIIQERNLRAESMGRGESVSAGYLEYFEDLVVRTRRNPPGVVQARLRLHKVSESTRCRSFPIIRLRGRACP